MTVLTRSSGVASTIDAGRVRRYLASFISGAHVISIGDRDYFFKQL